MAGQLDGIALGAIAAGGIAAYAGLKGISIPHALQAIVQGKNPGTLRQDQPITTTGGGGGGQAPAAPVNLSANEATGKMLAAARGWTGAQWDALYALWTRESGWSNTAQNSSSGAYGIPQSLPYTKMPRAAWPPSAGGQADPAAQIRWGLDYIAGRYHDPAGAWAHETANGWY